ncbi:dihydrofolate reductase [Thiohalorhabdus sp. Cl-TMA]|uniref:Dihydrofolate reductase n=1 Tax=Thiohalorhabdus methylotrophus TaxID=3242694 RepID=A0ABV4TUL4_9GAMM
MQITMIMVASDDGVIGFNNQLPWHLPDDLRFFVRQTRGKMILMGNGTYKSLEPTPEKPNPLPGRKLLVVTGRPGEFPYENDEVVPVGSVQEGLAMAEALDEEELMVAGGHSVFMEAWPFADRLLLTRVHGDFEGDTFISDPDPNKWKVMSSEYHPADERHSHPFTTMELLRVR